MHPRNSICREGFKIESWKQVARALTLHDQYKTIKQFDDYSYVSDMYLKIIDTVYQKEGNYSEAAKHHMKTAAL